MPTYGPPRVEEAAEFKAPPPGGARGGAAHGDASLSSLRAASPTRSVSTSKKAEARRPLLFRGDSVELVDMAAAGSGAPPPAGGPRRFWGRASLWIAAMRTRLGGARGVAPGAVGTGPGGALTAKEAHEALTRAKPRLVPIKIEPKTFFANERTFIHWMTASVLLITLAMALLTVQNDEDAIRSGWTIFPIAFLFIWCARAVALPRERIPRVRRGDCWSCAHRECAGTRSGGTCGARP